jgi:hypothetical protein
MVGILLLVETTYKCEKDETLSRYKVISEEQYVGKRDGQRNETGCD